jgi:hypothetical protein
MTNTAQIIRFPDRRVARPLSPSHVRLLLKLCSLLIVYNTGRLDRVRNPSFTPDARLYIDDDLQVAWRKGWDSLTPR